MIMICRLLVRVASLSPSSPSLSPSLSLLLMIIMRVAPRTLKLLPWPFICLISSVKKKRLKTRKQLKVEQTMCHVVVAVLVVIGTSA